jgi:fructan beta-fructosidase
LVSTGFFLNASNKTRIAMKNAYLKFTLLAAIVLCSLMCSQQKDLMIADFNTGSYGDWKTEGNAFGKNPSSGVLPVNIAAEHFASDQMASSYQWGDSSVGKLVSPEFDIARKYINFQIGGSRIPDKTCINLIVDGKVEFSATGVNDNVIRTNQLDWVSWDVSRLKGKKAVIELVDLDSTRKDAYISVDNIYQGDENKENETYVYNQERKFKVNNRYLNIPVRQGAYPQLLRISADGKTVREFIVELAESAPDYWMFLDVNEFKGKEINVTINKMTRESTGLKSMVVDSTVKGFENLYQEKNRPLFHFSSRRGWHNDPNGLVFYDGTYHMFYQHNPLGWPWGNMTWGHAISTDLVHWKELAPALYPDSLGTMFSGSAVVDWNNTAQLQQGKDKTLIALYTAAGGTSSWSANKPFTQCMAFSTDKGLTWTKYNQNPVIPHVMAENRDPKVVWDESGKQWVMALYLDKNMYSLFSSADLKTWKELQRINLENVSECPDFFQIALDGNEREKKWVLTGANGHFMAGTFDGKQFKPETKSFPSEWGKNYYAVQSYSDLKDGRRIQIGWMAGAEFRGMPFNQQMSFPRELTLKTTADGIRLLAVPAREISLLHGEKKSWQETVIIPGNNMLDPFRGDLYHIIAEFSAVKSTAQQFGFNIHGFQILYNTKTGTIKAVRPSDNAVSEVKVRLKQGRIRMEILLDKTSVEIFINDGEVPMAFYYIADEANKKLTLVSEGGEVKLNSLDIFELKSAW